MAQTQGIHRVSVYRGWTVADELREHADQIHTVVVGSVRLDRPEDQRLDLAGVIREVLGDVEEVRVSDVDGVRYITKE